MDHLQSLWAEILIEELVRNGVTQFCISPGSRNTPLVLAAAENGSAHTRVHFDERGAGYFAVGFAKASGKAATLICTSGTAVANYLPSIVEAYYSDVPLIVLTADRPSSLRDTGANQTIDQIGIFGRFVKWSADLPVPSHDIPIESMLSTVDDAVFHLLRTPAGPVHINCQFEEPLAPERFDNSKKTIEEIMKKWGLRHAQDMTDRTPEVDTAGSVLAQVDELLSNSKRPVIVAGRLDGIVDCGSIFRFAERISAPIMACVSSGLRFSGSKPRNLVTRYDMFLRDSHTAELLRPDLIIHLGGSVVSKPLLQYLDRADCEYVQVNNTPHRFDPLHKVSLRIEMHIDSFCRSLHKTSGTESLLNMMNRADTSTEDAVADALSDDIDNELAIASNFLRYLPGGSGLFLGNSMPIRDADGCGVVRDTSLRVCVNRGASGIDGCIATACGFAEGLGTPTGALVGDLALLHDLNSLSLVASSPVPIWVVVVNNEGGGIFEFLPGVRRHECFEEFFATRHRHDFEKSASMFGISYKNPKTLSSFRADLSAAIASGRSALLELRTNRQLNVHHHRRTWDLAAQAVRNALSS